MTYKQAEEQGYNVKKGAQGIMLENWQFTKEQSVLDEAGNVQLGDDGKPLTETVQLEKPIVTYFKEFNAKDIEGIEEADEKTFYEMLADNLSQYMRVILKLVNERRDVNIEIEFSLDKKEPERTKNQRKRYQHSGRT